MTRILAIFCLIISTIKLSGQEDHWEVYMAQYEKGPGSTIVNMDLKKMAPDKGLPFLFSAGVFFTDCSDGLPSVKELNVLNEISDSIVALVNRLIKNTLVGTFTYQCQRRDYFYVTDTAGLREQVTALIAKYFLSYKPAFNIQADKVWEAYLEFLYPSETIMEYIKNEKIVSQLEKAGDKLDKPRQVDHWLYFKTEADQNCFIKYAAQQHYKTEEKEKISSAAYPFKLHISRIDKVDISSISGITLTLEQEAKKCNGNYDGWETSVVK